MNMPPVNRKDSAYVDRKQILPKRVVKLSLDVARLQPGRYVYVVEVTATSEVKFQKTQDKK